MANYFIKNRILLLLIALTASFYPLLAQNSGSIWIKEFKPGSADLDDSTIDRQTLQFLDSLMQREDIEITFLGAADPTKWQLFGRRVKPQVADAWDEAKKLERASTLRQRYERGQIGTTDEPIRGVKVVWGPQRPDIFEMNDRLGVAETNIDSLYSLIDSLQKNSNLPPAMLTSMVSPGEPCFVTDNYSETKSTIASDWEVRTGFLAWTAGGPYDLSVPYVGLALKRPSWMLEFQGGFSPWSEYRLGSNRGDAFLLGSLHLAPKSWLQLKTGFFSGWEFLTNSDVWTMKIMGLTAGPKIKIKFFETYIGYTFGKLSSLTEERWCGGALLATNFHLKLN